MQNRNNLLSFLKCCTVEPYKGCDSSRVSFLFSPMKSQASGRKTRLAPLCLAWLTSLAALARFSLSLLLTHICTTPATAGLDTDMPRLTSIDWSVKGRSLNPSILKSSHLSNHTSNITVTALPSQRLQFPSLLSPSSSSFSSFSPLVSENYLHREIQRIFPCKSSVPAGHPRLCPAR